MRIIVSSFGYKFGTPTDADLLIDARGLLNPFRDEALRKMTGLDDKVWFAITKDKRWMRWRGEAITRAWQAVLPVLNHPTSSDLLIGVGCTGGRHRSVVGTLEVARALKWRMLCYTIPIMVGHRDLIREGDAQRPLRNLKTLLPVALEHPKKYFAGTQK